MKITDILRKTAMPAAMMIILAALVASCADSNTMSVEGTVEGAGDSTALVLEYSRDGAWLLADSAVTTGNGEFKISAEAPEYPSIYRLRLGDDAIYLPVDSLDRITVKTSVKAFATDYTLSGTDHAVQVMNIDRQARAFASQQPVDTVKYEAWKRQLAGDLLKDPSGIVAYYIINKSINGKPIFDPLNNRDLKVIGAVANAFHTYRPNDPRTALLVQTLLDGQHRRRMEEGTGRTIEAKIASLIDIRLQDVHGKMQSLEEVAGKGGVVILNYTMSDAEFAPALNKVLNDLYTKYGARGLQIYQIALDDNEADWLNRSRNLPWIVVRDPAGVQSRNVSAYNVLGVPTSFIIGRNGEIVERVEDPTLLDDAVARHL